MNSIIPVAGLRPPLPDKELPMSIKRMEAQLARLSAQIEASQAELSGLKEQRKELKARLSEAKKAVREGAPVPVDPEPDGLAERIGVVLTENVIEPIAELLSPTPQNAKREP